MRQIKITERYTARDEMSIELYFNEISKYDVLSPEEELELAKLAGEGDEEARDKLVLHNLRFVVSVAKMYAQRGNSAAKLTDLINEGNVGLIKAATKFDYTTGFKFISYAVWWVRQSMLTYLSNYSRAVRLPQNKIQELGRIERIESKLEQQLGRPPSISEIIEAAEADESITRGFDSQRYSQIKSATSSLDIQVGEGQSTTILDLMEAEVDSPDELADFSDKSTVVNSILDVLPTYERSLLEMRYGLNGNTEMSTEQIAGYYGVSGQTIRNRIEKTTRKLRARVFHNDNLRDEALSLF